VYFCTNLTTKGFESLGIELSSIINGDSLQHSKAINDVLLEEFCTVAEVIVAKGFASIHLEKYSTVTTTYFKLSCAGGSGPNRSKPHISSGQVGCIS
jgi:hypothetical protein